MSKSSKSVICGKVKCKKTVKSLAAATDCAMYRTVVEVHKRGSWHPICSIQHGTSFLLGRREVVESVAHLTLSNPVIIHGTIPHEKGLIEKGINKVKGSSLYKATAAPILASLPFFGSSVYGPLNEAALIRLQKNFEVAAALKRHKASLLRITEHAITDGMNICAISEAVGSQTRALRGTTEFPLILSDMKPEDAIESLKERGLLSISAGVVLIAIAIPLFIFLLSQL